LHKSKPCRIFDPMINQLNTITMTTSTARSLSVIAREIRKDWTKVYFGAVPYLDAMSCLDKVSDNYGMDSGRSIVAYFLANATTWKGETARNVKKELNAMIKR
jgi:hypothetical protein